MTRHVIQAIITQAEKRKIEEMAKKDCRSVSSYARKAIVTAIRTDEKKESAG